jgi:Xaa-Pro aminopeptidase
VAKSPEEIALIRYAAQVTGQGLRRVLRRVKPGIGEHEIEAEFAHEFLRRRCDFAYPPIIASGGNSCILHYHANDRVARAGEVLLLDVAAQYRRYNSDLTRTLPVGGRFSRRQRRVYDAVLRVQRAMTRALVPGKRHPDWLKEAEAAVEAELIGLGLLTRGEVRRQPPNRPAFKKYYMHGAGHVLGLDVHDVGFMHEPMQAGWVFTVEPAIYVPEEGFGVRIENTVLITEQGIEDLMSDIPIEVEEIEDLMAGG